MDTALAATDSVENLRSAVAQAVDLLSHGEVVALPTETVYGLAADATRLDAVLKIFEAKERPFFDPLIVHLPDRAWLERVAAIPDSTCEIVETLIAKFWPGPLTMVLPRQPLVPDLVTAGLETVAVRMSAHPVFRAVIAAFGKPLAAPSANRFGRISPTAADHVLAELGGRIPLVVDGGATEHGVESTIVRIDGDRLQILRSGPVTREQIADCGVRIADAAPSLAGGKMQAPGQLASHYAPRTRLLLRGVDEPALQRRGLLSFRGADNAENFQATEVLSPAGDLREAAATLFAKLRRLDDAGLDLIVAEPVPEQGLGVAIMDRLRKAAARG